MTASIPARIKTYSKTMELVALLLVTALVEGKAPSIIVSGFYIITLYLFLISKYNYYWIAYILIMYNYTGGFFESQHELFHSGMFSISYLESFSIVALVKTLSLKKTIIFFKRSYEIYAIYFVFMIFWGAMNGMFYGKSDFGLLYILFKNILLFPLFYTIPVLLNEEDCLRRLAKIFFAVLFINLFGQLFTLIFKESIFSIISLRQRNYLEENIRPIYGYYNIILTLLLAFYYYPFKNSVFSKKYLSLIIFSCILSIYLTATRGWIIALGVMLVAWIGMNMGRMKNLLIFIPAFIIFFLLASRISPIIEKQFNFTANRMATLAKIGKGNNIETKEMGRLTTRPVPVMKKFVEKPIFGWGISRVGYETHDIHVGNQSILMSGGIVGMLVILYMLYYIIKRTRLLIKVSEDLQINPQPLTLIYIFILGMFIIHSTSTQLFGYMTYFYPLHYNKLLFLAIIFSILNILFKSQYKKCLAASCEHE